MATVKITYTAPKLEVAGESASICPVFVPNNSYADSKPFEGTVYDTNVEGFGYAGKMEEYVAGISAAPTALLMFKAAMQEGTVSFTETAVKAQYYKELGAEFEADGFKVEVTSGGDSEPSEDAIEVKVTSLPGVTVDAVTAMPETQKVQITEATIASLPAHDVNVKEMPTVTTTQAAG